MLNSIVIIIFMLAGITGLAAYYHNNTPSSRMPGKKVNRKNKDLQCDFTDAHIKYAYLQYTAPGACPKCQRKYVFEICYTPTHYRAYILFSPSYGSRNASTHMTHRVPDEIHKDRYYVSWATEVKSFNDMILIAKKWAVLTQRYLETGKPISDG